MQTLTLLSCICTILGLWFMVYQEKRKPLIIKNVAVYSEDDCCKMILQIHNRKPYPINIESVQIYSHRQYHVEQLQHCKPEISSALSSNHSVSGIKKNCCIGAGAYCNIEFRIAKIEKKFQNIHCSIHSSHGYQELKYNRVRSFETNSIKICDVEAYKNYISPIEAWKKYIALYARYIWSATQGWFGKLKSSPK